MAGDDARDPYELVLTRRSIRKYRAGFVTPETLRKLVDAGRVAPSARNEQPCEFVVVTRRDLLQRLADIAENGAFFPDASACIAVFSRPVTYWVEDGSAATTQILLAAHALGLGTCWVAGAKKSYAPEVHKTLEVPTDLRLVSLIAVGYADEQPHPAKKPLEQVVHWETYGGKVE